MCDDLLLQELQSLREQLKISVDIIKKLHNDAPEFDIGDYMHGLGAEDYILYLYENKKEQEV